MSPKLDAYRVLQVRPDASQEEIKVAFRRLARRYHPDRADDAVSHAKMIEVNQAWELLGDPVRRAAYDRAHGIVHRERPGAGSGEAADDAGSPATRGSVTAQTGAPGAPGPDPWAAAAANPTGGGAADGGATASGRTGDPAVGTSGSAAVPPPPRPGGRPVGTLLPFGRYVGWTLGEVARVEPEYLEWLVRMPIGWQYRAEIGALLAGRGERTPEPAGKSQRRRRGLLGR